MTTPKPFIESLKYHDKNRRSAANMRTAVTRMADGTTGMSIFFDGFLMSLTYDELQKLARMIVHDMTEIEKRRNKPPRTISRSYTEEKTTNE